MTKAQYQVYNRLAKKQSNRRNDVAIVEESDTSCTFFVAFPGLYLTYSSAGKLLLSETSAERAQANKRIAVLGQRELTLKGELGGDDYQAVAPITVDDDDVPF